MFSFVRRSASAIEASPRLDADAALSQFFHHCGGLAFPKVDRSVVGQLVPSLDRGERPKFIALDPLAGRHANERAGTCMAQSQHRGVHRNGPETLPPVGVTRVQV